MRDKKSELDASRQVAGNESSNKNQVILPEGEYAKYLAEYAARIAEERTSKRESFYRTLITIAVGILTILGISSISNMESRLERVLKADIVQELSEQVKNQVDEEVLAQKTEIINDIVKQSQIKLDSYVAYMQLSLLFGEKEKSLDFSFSFDERAEIFSQVKIAAKTDSVRKSPAFKRILENLIDSFDQKDFKYDIDILEESIGADTFVDSPGIVWTFVQHYGLRVAGETDLSPDLKRTFEKYATEAYRHDIHQIVLPFEIALAFREAGCECNSKCKSLLEDLNSRDSAIIAESINWFDLTYINFDNERLPPYMRRARKLFEDLKRAYPAEFETLKEKVLDDLEENYEYDLSELEDLLSGIQENDPNMN